MRQLRTSNWWHIGHNGTHETYALSCAEFDLLVQRSAGRCDRCVVPYRRLVIDHDHALGPRGVRGLLCHSCNSMLGRIEKRGVPMDQRTADYLARPFHALIPPVRERDRDKQEKLSIPPIGYSPRRQVRHGRRSGRTGAGNTPTRNMRIPDEIYCPALAIADARKESLTDVVERALIAYAKRHRTDDPEASQATEST